MNKAEELLTKYIQKNRGVFMEIQLPTYGGVLHITRGKANSVADEAKRYFKDAEYYRDRGKFETGLACVAYSEGLLEALRMLEIAEFQWATEKGS